MVRRCCRCAWPSDGQQPFAEQALGALQRDAFLELLRRRDEDVFDPVGMADEIDLLRPEA